MKKLLFLVLLLVPHFALAQGADQEIVQLNKQAMDAYGNLEIDKAMELLSDAQSKVDANGISGRTAAQTYINLGMITQAGMGDNAAAMGHFKKALCYDNSILLDPLNSNPDMEGVFNMAKAQVTPDTCEGVTDGGDSTVVSAPIAAPVPAPVAPVPTASAPELISNDVLRHTTVVEQEKMTPVPFVVQTNPTVEVGKVVVFYKTGGESIFQRVEARQISQGWQAEVGCDTLVNLEPTQIEYYITVLDPAEQMVSSVGSESQPFIVNLVESPTYPPQLPAGVTAPAACQGECPPWNPQCNDDCAQYADLCSDENPCCEGLSCVSGVCEEDMGGGGGGDDEWDTGEGGESGPSAKYKVRFTLTGGSGIGLVPGGEYTDDEDDENYFPNMLHDGGVEVETMGAAWSVGHVRIGAMFNLPAPKLEVGIVARLNLIKMPAPEGYPMITPSVLAGVSYSLVGNNPTRGFEMRANAGFGWVNIMHRIPFDDCGVEDANNPGTCLEDNDGDDVSWYDNYSSGIFDYEHSDGALEPDLFENQSGYRKSGFLGVELGLDMSYWISKSFGINWSILIDTTFPQFAVHGDASVGVGFRF